jgi:hypothetical protein
MIAIQSAIRPNRSLFHHHSITACLNSASSRSPDFMSLIWIALYLLTFAASVILLFFLFTITTGLGRRVALLVYRFWVPLGAIAGVFLLVIIQEISNVRRSTHRLHDSTEKLVDSEVRFHRLGGMFYAQRNLYLAIVGFIVFAGLLLIAWQVQSWTARNDALKRELA